MRWRWNGRLRGSTHKVFHCNACRHQTSLIAGTVFQGTKLALTVWFLAIYLISQAKTGLSALALKRHLGVSYPTAWIIHHKLMQAMAARDARHVLDGQVQATMPTWVVSVAVARWGAARRKCLSSPRFLTDDGHPLRTKLTSVPGFTLKAIAEWAKGQLALGSTVLSDGLTCFGALFAADCTHRPTVVAGRKPKEMPEFQWINTVLGNLKTGLAGSYHAFDFQK